MQTTVEIECPQEMLLSLHIDANAFAEYAKKHMAIALFNDGKISSGMAALWLDIPRIQFLLLLMHEKKMLLLDDNISDYNKEISLL